jgi:hypothetical protein
MNNKTNIKKILTGLCYAYVLSSTLFNIHYLCDLPRVHPASSRTELPPTQLQSSLFSTKVSDITSAGNSNIFKTFDRIAKPLRKMLPSKESVCISNSFQNRASIYLSMKTNHSSERRHTQWQSTMSSSKLRENATVVLVSKLLKSPK